MGSMMPAKWRVSPFHSDLGDSDLSRNIRENSNSIFEIIPKLLIESEDPGRAQNARIILASGGGENTSTAIVLDFELIIITKMDKEIVGDPQRMAFEATIDFIVWRRSLLIVGLNNSEIILINPRTMEIRERRKVCPNFHHSAQRFFVDAFFHSNKDPEKIDIIAVNVAGIVYSFLNISLSDGSLDFTHDENVSIDVDTATIKVSVKKYLEADSKVVAVNSPSRDCLIFAEENGLISVIKLSNPNEGDDGGENELPNTLFNPNLDLFATLGYTPLDISIKKSVRLEGLLFVLLSNGQLEILYDDLLFPTQPLQLPPTSPTIQDFTLVHSPVGVKLWAICSDLSTNSHYVCIFKGGSFQLEFCVKIHNESQSQACFKFPTQSSPVEEPYCLLEVSSGSIKYYEMTETSKEITFQRLLDKGLFGKAELLAAQYGQDRDLIRKAKVRAMSKKLMHCKDRVGAQTLFNEILENLTAIVDAVFVCKLSVELQFPEEFSDISWVKELLNIGQRKAFDCNRAPEAKTILLTRKKFYTFEQVFPNSTVREWNNFNSTNTMLNQCRWFLDREEFDKSEKVWLRHLDEFYGELSLYEFGIFFWALFNHKLESPISQSLFKSIFPTLLEKITEEGTHFQIKNMTDVVTKQVLFLEREKSWPAPAIDFCKILRNILKEELGKLELLPKGEKNNAQKVRVCLEIAEKIQFMIQALSELSDLKAYHSILIPYEIYTQDDEYEVVNSMLNKLFFKDEINQYLSKFLKPFAQRKNLNINSLFFEHVKTVTGELMGFFNETDIPFEERLITLVDFISDRKMKLEGCLIMTEAWPVPWSQPMLFMVNRILKLDVEDSESSDLLFKIQKMKDEIPLRCIIQKYRFKSNFVNTEIRVELAIKKILTDKKENYEEECLELIKHTKFDLLTFKVLKLHHDITLLKSVDELESLNIDFSDSRLMDKVLAWIICEFNMIVDFGQDEVPDPIYMQCIGTLGKSIASQQRNERVLEFFRLKESFPSLIRISLSLLYSDEYPFNILELILREHEDAQGITGIVASIEKLCTISSFPRNDLLLFAALMYITSKMPRDTLKPEVWDFVSILIASPDPQFYLEDSAQFGIYITGFLMAEPLKYRNEILRFLHMLQKSKGGGFQAVEARVLELISKFLSIQRIFTTLHTKEIPLETEFTAIYRNTWNNYDPRFPLLEKLESFGETLLRYGEKDVLGLVFNSVMFELGSQPDSTLNPNVIFALKERLIANCEEYQYIEDDPDINRLVGDLQHAGVQMNAYSLQRRDKTRLLNTLIELNLFSLAMRVALLFNQKEFGIWSQILSGLMHQASLKELREVLERLKNVTELWMLPEFSQAWLKASENDPAFKSICPIPLD